VLILTGVLGLVQALFLPGFVAARALGVRGTLRTLTASLALSLLLNFALVSLLVDLGAYRREALFAIFAVECALAWWVSARRAAPAAGRRDGTAPPLRLSPAEAIAAAAVAALAAWYVSRVARAAAGIFSGWDDVASWNRWAMEWFRGAFPEHTWNYPQVLPVAWSLTYAFMGTDLVQSFARGMMPLFGLAAMLALVDRARGSARLAMLAAAWFAGTFLARVNNVTAGLADLPVACFAALALAECVGPREAAGVGAATGPARPWAALFAAGAALVKQAGLYLAAVVPGLAALREPPGRRLGAAVRGYGLAAAIAAPWYVLKQREIATGRETSEVAHVLTGAHGGLAPLERAAAGFTRLAEIAGGLPVLLAVLALGLLGLRDRAVRPLLLAVAIPFTLLWAFGFSYDPRNLSVALVAWAFGCGAGLASLVERVRGPALTIPRPRAAWGARAGVAGLAAVALAVAMFAIPDARLLAHQRRLQRGLGDPEVAAALADLRDAGALTGRVVAEPGVLLAYTPGWDTSFVLTNPADAVRLGADAARPDVRWLLLPGGSAPPRAPSDGGWEWRIERSFGRSTLWRRESKAPSLAAPGSMR